MRAFILSIIAAAIICALVTKISPEKGLHAAMLKLTCGVFLAFSILYPVTGLRIGKIGNLAAGIEADGAQAVAVGEEHSKKILSSVIKQRTQAYILDKAASLNVQLQVEVTLSDDDIPVPVAARLEGKISPYAKASLQRILTEDLGMKKEQLTWI